MTIHHHGGQGMTWAQYRKLYSTQVDYFLFTRCCGTPVLIALIVMVVISIFGGATVPLLYTSTGVRLPEYICSTGFYTGSTSCPSVPTVTTTTMSVSVGATTAAAISTDGGAVLSEVSWNDLTSQSLCNPATLIYQLYAIPNGLCDPKTYQITFPNNYFPVYTAGIVALSFILVELVSVCCIFRGKSPRGWPIILTFALIPLISLFYAYGYWTSFSVVQNYFNPSKPSFVPAWNATYTYMGLTTSSSSNRVVNVYQITTYLDKNGNKQLIPVPLIKVPSVANAFGFYVLIACLALVCLYVAMVVWDVILVFVNPSGLHGGALLVDPPTQQQLDENRADAERQSWISQRLQQARQFSQRQTGAATFIIGDGKSGFSFFKSNQPGTMGQQPSSFASSQPSTAASAPGLDQAGASSGVAGQTAGHHRHKNKNKNKNKSNQGGNVPTAIPVATPVETDAPDDLNGKPALDKEYDSVLNAEPLTEFDNTMPPVQSADVDLERQLEANESRMNESYDDFLARTQPAAQGNANYVRSQNGADNHQLNLV